MAKERAERKIESFPRVLLRFWMAFIRGLAKFNSVVILSIIYFFVLTPLAIVARATGRDRLDIRGKRSSLWKRRTRSEEGRERYERAF